jgi:hypothetical protein
MSILPNTSGDTDNYKGAVSWDWNNMTCKGDKGKYLERDNPCTERLLNKKDIREFETELEIN